MNQGKATATNNDKTNNEKKIPQMAHVWGDSARSNRFPPFDSARSLFGLVFDILWAVVTSEIWTKCSDSNINRQSSDREFKVTNKKHKWSSANYTRPQYKQKKIYRIKRTELARWQWHILLKLRHVEDLDAFWNCCSGELKSDWVFQLYRHGFHMSSYQSRN